MDYDKEINDLKMEFAVHKSDTVHGLSRLEEKITSGHDTVMDKLQQLTEAFRFHTEEHNIRTTEKRKSGMGVVYGIIGGVAMLLITYLWQHVLK